MNARHVLLALIVGTVVLTWMFAPSGEQSEELVGVHSPPNPLVRLADTGDPLADDVSFLNESGRSGIAIDAEIEISTEQIAVAELRGLNVRLYTDEGELLDAACYGDLKRGEVKNITYTNSITPDHVVITASSLETYENRAYTLGYHWRHEDRTFENGEWTEAGYYLDAYSEMRLPANLTNHQPCR